MYNPKVLIKESKWDSDIFNKKVGALNLETILTSGEINSLQKEVTKFDLVVIKDLTKNFGNSEIISNKLNGYIVDLNVQFSKNVSINSQESTENVDREKTLSSKEKLKVIEIASKAFEYSRFYNDGNIEKETADKIFEKWVKNSFDNDTKRFILYKSDEEVLGFLLLNINDFHEEITIELIAVDNNVVAKGIGKTLMNKFESSFSSKKYEKYLFRVGTQINNITAMNFYIKNNYKMSRESRTYHIWNNKSS